jgi:hypothetical protein
MTTTSKAAENAAAVRELLADHQPGFAEDLEAAVERASAQLDAERPGRRRTRRGPVTGCRPDA